MKRLVDLKCDECGHVMIDFWADDECMVMISDKRLHCDECLGTLSIILGAPQFSIKGPGVYDPGKH